MRLMAWMKVECVIDLPDEEIDNDIAFDQFTTAAMVALAGASLPGVAEGSWTLDSADTYWPGERVMA